MSFFKKHKFFTILVILAFGIGVFSLITKTTKRIKEKQKKKYLSAKQALSKEEEVIPVNVFKVAKENFEDHLVAMGTIKGGREIDLRFQVQGTIETFNFKEGDRVKEGEIIAQLNQREVLLKLQQAKIEYEQYRKLFSVGAIVKSKLDQAQVNLNLARSELEKTYLRAPKDGIIGNKNVEVGEVVTPNIKIATLVNIEDVKVEFGIIEKEIDRIFLRQKVTVNVDTYPGMDFPGYITNISPLIEGKSKTLTVTALLKNKGSLLLPGMFAQVKIYIFEQNDALVIPVSALIKKESGYNVFIVENERAKLVPISVGYISDEYAQVTAGLNEDELIITERPEELRDTSIVKIIQVEAYKKSSKEKAFEISGE